MPTFEEVRQAESQKREHTVGLAFSGGGIRSATFNLGILQGLAKAKLLRSIDYLSTVSGGGYIGAWLVSWTKRASGGLEEVEALLGNFENRPRQPGDTLVEPKEVNFLRDYSNYLTPRKGIFGADTWASIATYFRNVLLNQAILLAFLGAILLLPWCLVSTGRSMETWASVPLYGGLAAALAAGLLLLLAVAWASGQTAASSLTETKSPSSAAQKYVFYLVALPVLLSAFLTVIAMWLAFDPRILLPSSLGSQGQWPVVGALLYGVAHVIGVFVRNWVIKKRTPRVTGKKSEQQGAGNTSKEKDIKKTSEGEHIGLTRDQWLFIPIFAFVAGSVGGLLLEIVESCISYWKSFAGGDYYAVTWGPPLVVVVFLLTGALHIGLLKLLIENEEQEWWGRLGGLLLLVGIGWTALFGLAIYVPWLLAIWLGWLKTKIALVLGWAGTTMSGLFLGKSDKTSGKAEGNSSLELFAAITPYVFVLGLMVLLSLGIYWLGGHRMNRDAPAHPSADASSSTYSKNITISVEVKDANNAGGMTAAAAGGSSVSLAGSLVLHDKQQAASSEIRSQKSLEYWGRITRFSVCWLWICVLILALVALGLAYRVDINVFSMNLLYRNRLVRCYLGASRQEGQRHANPFTGFDPADDLSLAELQSEYGYAGPYPIVCAALNVTHGERLAWQERKAESFVFTPHFCGFEFPEMNLIQRNNKKGGFQKTEEYAYPRDKQDPAHAKIGGLHLGSAISISGAAASPNMGYHTSPPLAFLMTIFDVRLGWWLANSRYSNDQFPFHRPKGGPRCSLLYLLSELLASTTDRSKYVYLSDGGHFENLAIYELVRRRCKYIIACDAGEDEGMNFGDLGNAIRKCRSDFGVEILIDPAKLVQAGEPKFATVHGVHGKIRYPKGPNGEESSYGDLLYIKLTITANVPRDVLAYRDTHAGFPHQSTAEQWFDESQFESYRRLGLSSFELLAHLTDAESSPKDRLTIPQLFAGLG